MRTTIPLSLGGLLWLAATASAQIPDRFTNLQVLPKDTPKAELVRAMRGFASELGVRCHHCHVGPDNLQGMDFATDEKPTKRAAREMLRLVQTINGSIVPALPARDGARDGVSCYTCHRRAARPPLPLYQELLRAAEKGGGDAAVERYRELRRADPGAGRYDFGPEMLLYAVMRLRERGRADDALAVARLGVEQFPAAADPLVILGQLLGERGERDAARARFRKALELDPNHFIALRSLKELDAPPAAPPAPK